MTKYSQGADTSRQLKKKHHEQCIDKVKKLEQMIKAQKRINERLNHTVTEQRQAYAKQNKLTERIQAYEIR